MHALPSWTSSYFRKKSTFLCSCSQPEVLGEALFCLSVFSATVPSLPALFMNLTLALSGEKGHYCLKFVPAPRPIAWAGLPGQAESQVLWLNLSLPGQGQAKAKARASPGTKTSMGAFLLHSTCLSNSTLPSISSLPLCLPLLLCPSGRQWTPSTSCLTSPTR